MQQHLSSSRRQPTTGAAPPTSLQPRQRSFNTCVRNWAGLQPHGWWEGKLNSPVGGKAGEEGDGLSEHFWRFFRSPCLTYSFEDERRSEEYVALGIDGVVKYVNPGDFHDEHYSYRIIELEGNVFNKLEEMATQEHSKEGGGKATTRAEGRQVGKIMQDGSRWMRQAFAEYFTSEGAENCGKDNCGLRQLTTEEVYDTLRIRMSAGWENVPLPCRGQANFLMFKKPRISCKQQLLSRPVQTGAAARREEEVGRRHLGRIYEGDGVRQGVKERSGNAAAQRVEVEETGTSQAGGELFLGCSIRGMKRRRAEDGGSGDQEKFLMFKTPRKKSCKRQVLQPSSGGAG
eukprot:GHVS01074717.1.p1 GENE.GHVS01074717.1~~GHVS01074717.1.p1  ORF type:complete len:344 (+),score=68.47 GHVS01074717.1:813-1844(+)